MGRTINRWRGEPVKTTLALTGGTYLPVNFKPLRAPDRVFVSASVDCSLTWRVGDNDPGAVPASGVVSAGGLRKLLAGQTHVLEVSAGSSIWSLRTEVNSTLTIEAGHAGGHGD